MIGRQQCLGISFYSLFKDKELTLIPQNYRLSHYYLCPMKSDNILRDILPDILIDNFDIVKHEKTSSRFDIWLNEKKVKLEEDEVNPDIISHGFTDYRTIQDFPIRGRACYLHVCKRKWLDKLTGEVFSYEWDLSEHDKTRLNAEFVDFLKDGD